MANKDEKKSGNTLVHDTIALTVITLIAGILLGGVYTITKKPIEQQNEKIKAEAYAAVYENAEFVDDKTVDDALVKYNEKLAAGEWGEQYMDGGSFGGFGCGLCCMANVYSSLTEYQCSPVDMYRFAKKHTGYGGGMAIDWGYMRRSLTRLGFQCHVEHKQETYRQFRQNISDAVR